jgi:hypothetical protein
MLKGLEKTETGSLHSGFIVRVTLKKIDSVGGGGVSIPARCERPAFTDYTMTMVR